MSACRAWRSRSSRCGNTVYGALSAHLHGYVGAQLDINLLPDINEYNSYQPDIEGKSQIEATMDKYLRGSPGKRVLRKSVKGVIESEGRLEPPKPGNNVILTLDARIQYIAEQALRHPQLGRAAAVVLDPNTGEILAMATVPSFDPNVFIPSVSKDDWKKVNTDPAIPLVSRAVSAFPPGSTFKIVTRAWRPVQEGQGRQRSRDQRQVHGDRPFQLPRRHQLRRPLFQVLDRGQTWHAWHNRAVRTRSAFPAT